MKTKVANILESINYRWLVVAVVIFGSLTFWIDTYVVNIILPQIMTGFGINVTKASWVVNATLLGMILMMPASGWLGNTFGRHKIFTSGLALFAVSSSLCGLSWSIDSLIFFRFMIGIASGILMPTAYALVFETFPPEKTGFAIGGYALGGTVGIAVTQLLSAYMVDALNWRVFFYLTALIGFLGFSGSLLIFREDVKRRVNHFDLLGSAIIAIFLISLLLILTQGKSYGWNSNYILILLGILCVSFPLFVGIELKIKNPMVDLRLFKNMAFTSSMIIAFTYGLGRFSLHFLIPLFLQKYLNYTVYQTAVVFLPAGLIEGALIVSMGWLSDRIDLRFLLVQGIILYAGTLYWMSHISYQTSHAAIFGMLIMRGTASAVLFPSLTKACLGSLPEDKVGFGSGMMNLNRMVGGMLGVAVFGTLLDSKEIYYKQMIHQGQMSAPFGMGQFLHSVKGLFLRSGDLEGVASVKSLFMLDHLLSGEAMINAFKDCFLMTMIIFIFALFSVAFLKYRN